MDDIEIQILGLFRELPIEQKRQFILTITDLLKKADEGGEKE